MNKNTGDGELEELKDRAEKMLYDLFYKGLNAGEDTVLQYQFDHELAVKIRYVERCVKGAKDELADILTIFTEKAAQEANKARLGLLTELLDELKELEQLYNGPAGELARVGGKDSGLKYLRALTADFEDRKAQLTKEKESSE